MVLPLNLAMTPSEIAAAAVLPERISWMSCHFCSITEGITNIPDSLPEGAMLILTDRESCAGHSPDLVAQQLLEAVQRLGCESVLLDFQRPCNAESAAMVSAVTAVLPCPVAVTEAFAAESSRPVFLAPCPLQIPLESYLRPWEGHEIWLEAALCQQRISVTRSGTTITPVYPAVQPDGGFYDERLHCRYHTTVSDDQITFTLFDTPQTLQQKLENAHSLGVRRAVGLWQELGSLS